VTLLIKKLHLNNCSNFEHLAREARYNFYKSISSKGDRIALGQQLDDSFEWSLMQQFKSSSLTPILGIPLVNEKVIRPLMCFSAMQIRYCLKFLNISYIVDPTNNETKYERNYIRHVLIPRIKNRYPSYLCHYVARSNCLAYNLGKHCKIEDDQNWIRFEDRFGGIGIYAKDLRLSFNGGGSRLTDVIRELSQSSRGSLRKQVQMMIEAQQKGKKGPMIFSGGVYGFMDKGLFYFLHSEQLRKVHELDEKLSLELRDAQIPDVCHKLDKQKWITQSVFPFLICSNDKDTSKTFGPGLKKTHFLFPKSTKVLLDRGLYFQTYTRALSYSKGRRLENNVSFYFLQSFGLQ
jgi:tRNA(Ile)-lysidine synthase